jgi:CubicO group peptidase (beta-lactamase class C family)
MLSCKSVSAGVCTIPMVAIAAWVLLSAPLPAAQFGPPPNAALSADKLSRIDDFLNDQVAQGKIPGAVVLIQRHGKPVYFKWFGKRDVDAGVDMTPDAIFPLHSLTKTVTSFAAMMLVDRGKIKLDDPVAKYIPSFAGMKVGVERKDRSGKAVLDLVPLRRPSAAAYVGDHLRLLRHARTGQSRV